MFLNLMPYMKICFNNKNHVRIILLTDTIYIRHHIVIQSSIANARERKNSLMNDNI